MGLDFDFCISMRLRSLFISNLGELVLAVSAREIRQKDAIQATRK
jgi:hypothetical protein